MDINMPEFCILPKFVYMDHSIPPLARILFVIVETLSHKEGYCYATNKYLGEMTGIDERSIRRLLGILENNNYIKIVLYKNKPNNSKRRIYILKKIGQTSPNS